MHNLDMNSVLFVLVQCSSEICVVLLFQRLFLFFFFSFLISYWFLDISTPLSCHPAAEGFCSWLADRQKWMKAEQNPTMVHKKDGGWKDRQWGEGMSLIWKWTADRMEMTVNEKEGGQRPAVAQSAQAEWLVPEGCTQLASSCVLRIFSILL